MIRAGEHEDLKAAVHGGLLVFSAICFVYNVVAFAMRREPHLAMNAGVYGFVMELEIKQIAHHMEKR